MKNKKNNHNIILFTAMLLTGLAFFILKLFASYENSEGMVFMGYTWSYPLILLGEYILVTVLFIPFVTPLVKDTSLRTYLLPLLYISSLGMMRIDSPVMSVSSEADHSPAIMFIVLLITLELMVFTGFTLSGVIGSILGTAIFPAFGFCFTPFIAAAAFFINDKAEGIRKTSLICNSAVSLVCAVYSLIKSDTVEFSFSKNYIPIILLIVCTVIFFAVKKEFTLIPMGLLPALPLIHGAVFGSFGTPLFVLSASVAPFVITMGIIAVTGSSKKTEGCMQKLAHNPASYIIMAVFIIHTALPIFSTPGFFRNTYI